MKAPYGRPSQTPAPGSSVNCCGSWTSTASPWTASIPDVQIERLQGMFAAAGWQVLTCKWGRRIQKLFLQPGGRELRERLEAMPNEEYQRMLRSHPGELHERLLGADPQTRHSGISWRA